MFNASRMMECLRPQVTLYLLKGELTGIGCNSLHDTLIQLCSGIDTLYVSVAISFMIHGKLVAHREFFDETVA